MNFKLKPINHYIFKLEILIGNMKKIEVAFNPGVHPQFEEVYNYPPKGVKYRFTKPSGDHNSPKKRKFRIKFSNFHTAMQIPRMNFFKGIKGCDMIHSTRGIIPLNNLPWVVDGESGSAFSGLNWVAMRKPMMSFLIKKFLASPNCKKIMPQSDAAKKSLLENLDCSKFEDKIETVYLANHTTKFKRVDTGIVRISFIGKGFYDKGGNDLHEAFKILNKKYPGKISLKYKGDVPEDKKINLPNVKYLTNLPKEEFYNEIFRDCDIYVQPTTVDSYGVSIQEAMSTGLPIVCTDDFTLPELVEDGYNGFLVKSPVHWYDYGVKGDWEGYENKTREDHPETVKELVEKISILVEDPELRKKMGKNSFNLVDKGKFSIAARNKKLRRIYEEAISD
jgi:glycosyltransferase involved in cell wall biosynthesis